SESDRGRRHALLEIERVEREPVTEELDDVVVTRAVVDRHGERIASAHAGLSRRWSGCGVSDRSRPGDLAARPFLRACGAARAGARPVRRRGGRAPRPLGEGGGRAAAQAPRELTSPESVRRRPYRDSSPWDGRSDPVLAAT